MIGRVDVRPLESRVGDFIAGLKILEMEPITSARVSQYMEQMRPSPRALAPYILWSRERYSRNLIYRDNYFELIALCWLPGQRTPIHSHNGQLGWITVVQGELACHNYRFVRSEVMKKVPAGDRGRSGCGRPVEVELLRSANCRDDGTVAVVDRLQTTHQLENLEKASAGSISLHLYSKPIDSCVLFDETSRCCERRTLQYYSANGVILADKKTCGTQTVDVAA